MKINFNQKVRVKLTMDGIIVLFTSRVVYAKYIVPDKDDFAEFQLWQFVEIFGLLSNFSNKYYHMDAELN